MSPQAAQVIIIILECLGHQIRFPEGQVCCGQVHTNTGYLKQVVEITRNHVGTFPPAFNGEWSAIIIPSGSCTGAARHEQGLVAEYMDGTTLTRRIKQIAAHAYGLAELLIDVLGTEDVGTYFPHMVTCHPACYSLRVVKVADRLHRLLEAVRVLTLIDLPDAEICYGLGGAFFTKNSETSTVILADRMSNVMSTRAEVLCADDYSYLIRIDGGLSRVNSGMCIMCLAGILTSIKDVPFRGNISPALKHARHTGSSQHTQAVAR